MLRPLSNHGTQRLPNDDENFTPYGGVGGGKMLSWLSGQLMTFPGLLNC